MIERMYPNLPRIELFSRSPREGWAAWGNQSGDDPLEIPERAAADAISEKARR
jgi:N6-adenosine-specific RNA methylase IME4